MKRPWRAHYTRDWAIDPFVRGLDLEARMVYFELLDIAWDEGGLQQDWVSHGTYVAKRIGISQRKFVACWERVRSKFEEKSPGVWSNARLESERDRAEKHAEKQSNNAKRKKLAPATAEPPQKLLAEHSESESESDQKEDPPASAGQGVLQLQDPPPPKKPKAPPNPDREATIEVLSRYKQRWVEIFQPKDGKSPTVTDADWSQLGRVVKEHGREAASGFVDRFLDDPDPFLAESVHALRLLPGRVDRYRATKKPSIQPKTNRTPTVDDRLREHEERLARDRAAREAAK